ncbi:MAG: LexA binding domain [Bacteroidota bacterium]
MDKGVGKKIQWRKVCGRPIDYNPVMTWTRSSLTAAECEAVSMTPVQREMYILIDEFWKRFGCGPTYRELEQLRGVKGLGNVKRLVDALVKLGVVKRVAGMERSVRPSYMKFHAREFE